MEQLGNRSAEIAERVRNILANTNSAGTSPTPSVPVTSTPAAVPGRGLPPPGIVRRLDTATILANLTATGIQLAVSRKLEFSQVLSTCVWIRINPVFYKTKQKIFGGSQRILDKKISSESIIVVIC